MPSRRHVVRCLGAAVALPAMARAATPATAPVPAPAHAADCVFCRIDAGELEGNVVWRDEYCMALADRYPFAPGHTLLIPRTHVRDLYALPPDLAAHLYAFAPRLARELKRAFQCDGLTCLQNNEAAGGQSVFHFHMHFVPRTTGVELWKRLNPRPELPAEESERLFAPVKAALAG